MGIGSDGNISAILTVAGYAGTLIAAIAVGAWRARGIQAMLEKKIDDRIAEVRKDAADKRDEGVNQIGESLRGIRQAITDMAMWNRDTFVRRDDFQVVIDGLAKSMDGLRTDVKDGNIRLNDKLDRAIRDKD